MFDVGFAEIFLLALIGLIVLGPEKLPAVARTLGGLVRSARSSWYGLRRSIEAELAEADVSAPIRDVAREMKEAGAELDKAISHSGELPTDGDTSGKSKTRDSTDGDTSGESETRDSADG